MDAINTPLLFIDSLFQESVSKNENNARAAIDAFSVPSIYTEMLGDSTFETNIPVLVPAAEGSFKKDVLVRHRGLIRDIYDVEFYSALLNVVDGSKCSRLHLAKYRDSLDIDDTDTSVDVDFDSPHNLTLERLPILLTPIPGESNWVSGTCSTSRKRRLSSGDDSLGRSIFSRLDSTPDPGDGNREGDTEGLKQQHSDNALASAPTTVAVDGCLIKVYDLENEPVSFKLNDVVEVVGVYSQSPYLRSKRIAAIAGEAEDGGMFNSCDCVLEDEDEEDGYSEPAPYATRIHCIVFRRLGSGFPLLIQPQQQHQHGHHRGLQPDFESVKNRLLFLTGRTTTANADVPGRWSPWARPEPLSPHTLQQLAADSVHIREAVISHISKSLGNDRLAADYVLLCLLSRVITRQEASGSLLGMISISLDGIQKSGDGSTKQLLTSFQSAVSDIIPRVLKIAANTASYNASSMLPRRDSVNCTMSSSPLLMALGTVLLLDGTDAEEAIEAEWNSNTNTSNNSTNKHSDAAVSGDTTTAAARTNGSTVTKASTGTETAATAAVGAVGELTAVGMRSLRALQSVVKERVLPVDVGYSEVKISTESPVIILTQKQTQTQTQTQLSLPTAAVAAAHAVAAADDDDSDDCDWSGGSSPLIHINLDRNYAAPSHTMAADQQPTLANKKATNNDNNDNNDGIDMARCRLWLAVIRTIDVKIGETLSSIATEDFVRSRKKEEVDVDGGDPGVPRMTISDLHCWLGLARLVAASFGSTEVLPEHWEYMKNMERMRMLRFK